MKKYLLALALLSVAFPFIDQVAAVPCSCPSDNLQAPQIEGCSEDEGKPTGTYMKQLGPKECAGNCDCAPGNKCSVQQGQYGGQTGQCVPQ